MFVCLNKCTPITLEDFFNTLFCSNIPFFNKLKNCILITWINKKTPKAYTSLMKKHLTT